MSVDSLKKIITDCVNDIEFSFNGKQCGVTSVVDDYIPTFTVWFGDKYFDTGDIDEVINTPYFDGMSLGDICAKIEFSIL